MDLWTYIAVGAVVFGAVMVVVMIRKAIKAKAQGKLLRSLAATAHERLDEAGEGTGTAGSGAIDSALVRKDESSLRAYANLMGKQPSFDIIMAVFTVEYMRIGKKPSEVSVTPESLTPEQVKVFTEITTAIGNEINLANIIDNNANRVAYYVMEHLSDYPLILSIINTRGIKELDQIKAVLTEMKLSQSGALVEGSL
jgi:hypothetical protein